MGFKITRFIIRVLLKLLVRLEVRGRENIPQTETYVIAANHLGLVDGLLPFAIVDNNNLVVLVGEKWGKIGFMRWLGRRLNFIFVDRFNPDLKAIRQVISRMKHGEVLVITPEGTRSKVGTLLEGKAGVSYLAAKMGYPILPAGISGSFDPLFFAQLKRLRRPHVVVNLGATFSLPPIPPGEREAALQAYTEEIMCRIAALIPQEQHGFYAGNPRVAEFLPKA